MNTLHAELVDHMGNDQRVDEVARISFANLGDAERTEAQREGLLNYLAKHNHWTPFAHCMVTLRMVAPIPIRTQCLN